MYLIIILRSSNTEVLLKIDSADRVLIGSSLTILYFLPHFNLEHDDLDRDLMIFVGFMSHFVESDLLRSFALL